MQVCKKCVLPETFPGISFNEQGICNACQDYCETNTEDVASCFPNEESLKRSLQKFKNPNRKYDLLVPISGGVDSCFTLLNIVEKFELRPLVFHSDHGWDHEQATRNVENLCRDLDVDLVIWKNDLRFMRRLFKYFNESRQSEVSACYACGNMLYLNGLELADAFKIPLVVNGYSKGQAAMMKDDQKSQNWYSIMIEVILETGDREFFNKFTNKWKMLEKQIIYQHRQDLEKDPPPGKILFIPLFIFKFYQTDKEKLEEMCRKRFDWRPIEYSYPARTTNCKMIWFNSHVDLKKRAYTHYHDEYSTLIRAGEISREQAVADLELKPPDGLLEELAGEIDFSDPL